MAQGCRRGPAWAGFAAGSASRSRRQTDGGAGPRAAGQGAVAGPAEDRQSVPAIAVAGPAYLRRRRIAAAGEGLAVPDVRGQACNRAVRAVRGGTGRGERGAGNGTRGAGLGARAMSRIPFALSPFRGFAILSFDRETAKARKRESANSKDHFPGSAQPRPRQERLKLAGILIPAMYFAMLSL